jgi:hypothetical protein
MGPILTRCGYRCDLCLAYRPNIESNPSNRQKLSDGWFEYFGFRIQPEDILCDGCMADHGRLIDEGCPVRPCVLERKLENCAACDAYICDKLKERIVVYEEVIQRVGKDIPIDAYTCFIEPYENLRRLDAYRKTGEVVG